MMQTDFGTLKTLPAAVLCILLGTRAALGTDWPQFRGPNRDGNWDEMGILESFPREGLKIRWRQPVGGGWSSPVVVQGRVFVFDVELIKPSARERLHCFEEKTGKVLWVYAYEEKYGEWSYVPERGAGPTATPIVERDRIYVVGANGNTHCLDVKAGTVIWEKNIGREYQVAEMSCRPSPLIEGSLLIVFTGAKPGASVLALDKLTGKEVWKALDDPVSNSSPHDHHCRWQAAVDCLERQFTGVPGPGQRTHLLARTDGDEQQRLCRHAGFPREPIAGERADARRERRPSSRSLSLARDSRPFKTGFEQHIDRRAARGIYL